MGRRKEEEGTPGTPNFILVTDQKEDSGFWFKDGLKFALDGFASTSMVNREELKAVLESDQEVGTLIIDTVYTKDWKELVEQLSTQGRKVIVACVSPDFEDTVDLYSKGAADFIIKKLYTQDLRHDLLGK